MYVAEGEKAEEFLLLRKSILTIKENIITVKECVLTIHKVLSGAAA